jgi:hypothetical protein
MLLKLFFFQSNHCNVTIQIGVVRKLFQINFRHLRSFEEFHHSETEKVTKKRKKKEKKTEKESLKS